jgi:hypothetical protein
LGILQCRACSLIWNSSITPTSTNQNIDIVSYALFDNPTNTARINPRPYDPPSEHVYICLGYDCGLSWRTDVKMEWMRGNKKPILLLGGGHGKLCGDCGVKIFKPGKYEMFEIVPLKKIASALSGIDDGEKTPWMRPIARRVGLRVVLLASVNMWL